MRKIIAGLFITLDGVVEAPGDGDTTLPNHKGWSMPFSNADVGGDIIKQMDNVDAFLLGRVTYEFFADFWSKVPEDNPFSERMNNMKKLVVTTTLEEASWKNSEVVSAQNFAEAITALKQQDGKDLSVTGSVTLVQSLIRHNLLDELQLMLSPVILGVGQRLFEDDFDKSVLTLLDSRVYDTGMVRLNFGFNTK